MMYERIVLLSDTKEERNALMQHVYPRLSQYCRDKHGLEFQVSHNVIATVVTSPCT